MNYNVCQCIFIRRIGDLKMNSITFYFHSVNLTNYIITEITLFLCTVVLFVIVYIKISHMHKTFSNGGQL